MSLYYEDEFVQLHHGDCRGIRGWTLADVLVTDPPYGMDYKDAGPGMGDLGMPWGNGDEEVYVLGGGFVGKRESNVIRARTLMSSDARRPDHPTPKPVALMEVLIEKCPPGVIADTFAGSGATLIAARNLGRKAIGVELEEKYCELIVSRLAQQAFDFGALA